MVTVVTMVPSGMMVRSISTFLVGVMLVRRDVACRAFKDAGHSWNSSYKAYKAIKQHCSERHSNSQIEKQACSGNKN